LAFVHNSVMDKEDSASSSRLTISALQRETGLAKDTLRVWERRYGFPMPRRDPAGEREYGAADLEKLRAIKRLLDAGHRPGRLMALSVEELRELSQRSADMARAGPAGAAAPRLAEMLELLRRDDLVGLRGELRQAQVRLGLSAFVVEVVAPFNTLVGDAWMRGQLEIYQEHGYTEAVQRVLRSGIQSLPEAAAGHSPRMVFSTLPGEPHGIGLLMVEALCAAEGANCCPLGVQTPVGDLLRAAEANRADVLALSFTACLSSKQVHGALADLRLKLPADVELWVGGSSPALRRHSLPGVTAMQLISDVPPALQRWRTQHAAHVQAPRPPGSHPHPAK
jgi:DNA-binding transcriptional MerR regulator/methylmalonyl-CoA mutase cobalamin-binding subunit